MRYLRLLVVGILVAAASACTDASITAPDGDDPGGQGGGSYCDPGNGMGGDC